MTESRLPVGSSHSSRLGEPTSARDRDALLLSPRELDRQEVRALLDPHALGILMRGEPRPGTSSYKQGSAPSIGFGDTARVLGYRERECVAVGCYEHVLVIDETNPLAPGDGHQLKYYGGGVGNISVAPGKGGTEREILDLVKVQKLRPRTLRKLHQAGAAARLARLPHGPQGVGRLRAGRARELSDGRAEPSVRRSVGRRARPAARGRESLTGFGRLRVGSLTLSS